MLPNLPFSELQICPENPNFAFYLRNINVLRQVDIGSHKRRVLTDKARIASQMPSRDDILVLRNTGPVRDKH